MAQRAQRLGGFGGSVLRTALLGLVPLALLGFGSLASAGCGSSRAFEGGVFRDGKVAFRVPDPPEGWRRIDVEGASLAYRDGAHAASVLVNGRCGERDDDTPLVALTAHLVMGTTERQIDREETLPFDGREARHTVMRAKLDGVPMTYDLYVLKKDGCVYDLVYVAEPGRFAEGSPAFERFVSGFRTITEGS